MTPIEFIQKFKSMNKQNVLETTFTQGYCYYFAVILKTRFPNGEIYYDKIHNHFVFQYKNRLYDITGDVTKQHNHDDLTTHWNNTITKDCILK